MNFIIHFQLFIYSKGQDCMIHIENVLDSGLAIFASVDKKLQLNHFEAAAKEICEISANYAAEHSGPFVTSHEPKKCLINADGNCENGGICPLHCGQGGYCCSKILIELNGNCPAGYFNATHKMQHSHSGAVASIPRIVGRDHVCVARNKTNILRKKKMLKYMDI